MAITPEKLNIRKLLEKHCDTMPFYVKEYVQSKSTAGLSYDTLLQYVYRYKHFFNWLLSEGHVEAENVASIPYSELDTLRKDTVEMYIQFLRNEDISKKKEKDDTESNAPEAQKLPEYRGEAIVALTIQALKSLFNYLTKETEDKDGECYFYRNVMSKIVTHKNGETASRRARDLNSVILNDDEISAYLKFIDNGYIETLESAEAKSRYERDKIRDLAINTLILGTGMRVGEIASIEMKNIHLHSRYIDVVRKGNKPDSVSVLESAIVDLERYMDVRESKYPGAKKSPFLFVSVYGGVVRPLSRRAIQNIVNKYTSAFFRNGKSPHKLRHSFAVDFIRSGGDIILLRDQLGHSDIKTTSLYTNMSSKDGEKVLNEMDKRR
ncbi:tyrosine recombinase XerS [Lysinibacillus xylanilyticus]|uniref:tyrosine recombinase XerS n=2 Tax=Lysinibacillus TaxID=400634 RepID=UPI002B247830|nr:tyrosine recombinase XerS [Lysinibacillus xylanilyticus]MEB2282398.1 tyrosine recombinase XerS [Lysinibacillus xylanilyticus]